MATTMKGLLKGLRYITQIFDDEKEPEMQIGFPTDVKHVAHIGSDGPSANTPSWMNDFKAPQHETGQVGSKGDVKNQGTKFNPEGKNQTGGVGLQELLPPTHTEKPKNKTRRKSTTGSPHDSPTRRSGGLTADVPPKQSRRHRSSHSSMDSSSHHDSSSHRRRHHHNSVPDMESSYPLTDSTIPPRKPSSRQRKLKGLTEGELSMKNPKGKEENNSSSHRATCPFTDIGTGNAEV